MIYILLHPEYLSILMIHFLGEVHRTLNTESLLKSKEGISTCIFLLNGISSPILHIEKQKPKALIVMITGCHVSRTESVN